MGAGRGSGQHRRLPDIRRLFHDFNLASLALTRALRSGREPQNELHKVLAEDSDDVVDTVRQILDTAKASRSAITPAILPGDICGLIRSFLPEILNEQDFWGATPLMLAVSHWWGEWPEDGFPVIELLVEAGADLNIKDNDGGTVLGFLRNLIDDFDETEYIYETASAIHEWEHGARERALELVAYLESRIGEAAQ